VVCQSGSNIITSGGGFSQYYAQPSYQKAAVAGYFAAVKGTTKEPYAGFDASKRAYPDVSLAAAKYRTIIGRKVYGLYGTSAAAPVVAGFFSNVNAARLAAGKGSLGWINPALYEYGSAFVNDITSGDNKCGALNQNRIPTCCRQGFTAVPGWDPTTGLGSINYGKMAIVLESSNLLLSKLPSSNGRSHDTLGTCLQFVHHLHGTACHDVIESVL
jgi:tripeptidyl-peptidase I